MSTRRTAAASRSRALLLSVGACRSITTANIGLPASKAGWWTVKIASPQFETTTPNYTFFNVSAGYKFQAWRTYNYLYVRATNLLDAEGRDHLSFLKEVFPLPGRGVVVGLRSTF